MMEGMRLYVDSDESSILLNEVSHLVCFYTKDSTILEDFCTQNDEKLSLKDFNFCSHSSICATFLAAYVSKSISTRYHHTSIAIRSVL
jgi:hypothetical protein